MGVRTITCLGCGCKKLQPKSTLGKFCSLQCQQDHALRHRASLWLGGKMDFTNKTLRRIIGLLRGYFCESCGLSKWQGKAIVLEVEHKDGNSENNSPENVCLICPNCHSQTPTYKGANKGNGRHYRRIRYAEGKSY